jgi:cold shock CspA family protein/ribosome-associated translation inhibitor RaiA
MQEALQVTFRGLDRSEAIEQRIVAKAEDLARFSDRILRCHVTVETPHNHHYKGKRYTVRVDVHLPDRHVVVDRQDNEDVYVAIRDTFDAAVRQVEDHSRRARGEVKHHFTPDHGTVTKLFRDDGYGFAQLSDGTDVYFHENAVAGGAFGDLMVGDEVRLVVAAEESDKGPQASTVTPIGKHHVVDRPARAR